MEGEKSELELKGSFLKIYLFRFFLASTPFIFIYIFVIIFILIRGITTIRNIIMSFFLINSFFLIIIVWALYEFNPIQKANFKFSEDSFQILLQNKLFFLINWIDIRKISIFIEEYTGALYGGGFYGYRVEFSQPLEVRKVHLWALCPKKIATLVAEQLQKYAEFNDIGFIKNETKEKVNGKEGTKYFYKVRSFRKGKIQR